MFFPTTSCTVYDAQVLGRRKMPFSGSVVLISFCRGNEGQDGLGRMSTATQLEAGSWEGCNLQSHRLIQRGAQVPSTGVNSSSYLIGLSPFPHYQALMVSPAAWLSCQSLRERATGPSVSWESLPVERATHKPSSQLLRLAACSLIKECLGYFRHL